MKLESPSAAIKLIANTTDNNLLDTNGYLLHVFSHEQKLPTIFFFFFFFFCKKEAWQHLHDILALV